MTPKRRWFGQIHKFPKDKMDWPCTKDEREDDVKDDDGFQDIPLKEDKGTKGGWEGSGWEGFDYNGS